MPAKSVAQFRLMQMAKHDPSKVSAKNRGVLGMTDSQLNDFTSNSPKGLPKRADKGSESGTEGGNLTEKIFKVKKYRNFQKG